MLRAAKSSENTWYINEDLRETHFKYSCSWKSATML